MLCWVVKLLVSSWVMWLEGSSILVWLVSLVWLCSWAYRFFVLFGMVKVLSWMC